MVALRLPTAIKRWQEKRQIKRRTDELRKKFANRPSDIEPIKIKVLGHNLIILPVIHGHPSIRASQNATQIINQQIEQLHRVEHAHPFFVEGRVDERKGMNDINLRKDGEGYIMRKRWERRGFDLPYGIWPIGLKPATRELAEKHLKPQEPSLLSRFRNRLSNQEIDSVLAGRMQAVRSEALAANRMPIDRIESWIMAAEIRYRLNDKFNHDTETKKVVVCGWRHGDEIATFLKNPRAAKAYYNTLPEKLKLQFRHEAKAFE